MNRRFNGEEYINEFDKFYSIQIQIQIQIRFIELVARRLKIKNLNKQ